MGYFANGTEGAAFYERYCEHCVHMPLDPMDGACPVWAVHQLYNYEQVNNPEHPLRVVLDSLIVQKQDERCFWNECAMYHPRGPDSALEAEGQQTLFPKIA